MTHLVLLHPENLDMRLYRAKFEHRMALALSNPHVRKSPDIESGPVFSPLRRAADIGGAV